MTRRGNADTVSAQRIHSTIKQWPEAERPRERLVREGSGSVSNAELLAILLRTGSRGRTALDLARNLVVRSGSFRQLSKWTFEDFVGAGIGPARAAVLTAAFELARRSLTREESSSPFLKCPEDVLRWCGPKLRDLPHEEFWALLLSSSNQLVHEVRVTKGTLNSSLVHPRECFTDALKLRCASVIFVHNHPSGNPEPSEEDRVITKQLVDAGKILGIPVHDHLIIAGGQCTSFAERGML